MHDGQNSLVSVIIPVYKVEEYLRECVDSIINQTYKNLEIILVDDGSPDKCGEICDEYARNDSRVAVYHIENGGASVARNYGVAMSHGEYIAFVDSDDVMKSTFVETLMDILKKYEADIVFSSYVASSDSATLHEIKAINDEIHTGCIDADEALRRMFYQEENFIGSLWGKIYKRSMIEGVKSPEEVYTAEDIATLYRILLMCERVAFTSEKLYGYRLRNDSKYHMGNPQKMLFACKSISRNLYSEIEEKRPELKLAAASRIFSLSRSTYFRLSYARKEERMQVWAEMKKYRSAIIFDPHARKRERIAALLSYLGADIFHVLFSWLYKKQQMME